MIDQESGGPTAIAVLRPFGWRIGLTYGLTLCEDLLELSYPWATGVAINGLLAHDYKLALPLVAFWGARSAIGCFRQMYDTRLYTSVYNAIAIQTILRQRKSGIDAASVAARSTMSREFVTFFERDVPVVIASLIGIFGSAAILFWYDLVIGALVTMLFVPVYFINRMFMRRSRALNFQLNNQLEKEVDVITPAVPQDVAAHFSVIKRLRVRLSDAEAFNWTSIEVMSIVVFVCVLVRATYLDQTDTGDIFAILVYVWRVMENLDNVPQIVKQLSLLQDIGKRIEAGGSVDDIQTTIEQETSDLAAPRPESR